MRSRYGDLYAAFLRLVSFFSVSHKIFSVFETKKEKVKGIFWQRD